MAAVKSGTERPAGTKFYIVHVWGGVDVTAYGPFSTPTEQFAQAEKLFADNNSSDDVIFGLDILPDGTPVTEVYSSDAFAEGD